MLSIALGWYRPSLNGELIVRVPGVFVEEYDCMHEYITPVLTNMYSAVFVLVYGLQAHTYTHTHTCMHACHINMTYGFLFVTKTM